MTVRLLQEQNCWKRRRGIVVSIIGWKINDREQARSWTIIATTRESDWDGEEITFDERDKLMAMSIRQIINLHRFLAHGIIEKGATCWYGRLLERSYTWLDLQAARTAGWKSIDNLRDGERVVAKWVAADMGNFAGNGSDFVSNGRISQLWAPCAWWWTCYEGYVPPPVAQHLLNEFPFVFHIIGKFTGLIYENSTDSCQQAATILLLKTAGAGTLFCYGYINFQEETRTYKQEK